MSSTKTKVLLDQKDFPFNKLDSLFKKVQADLPDGFVVATDGQSARYLIVIEGEPYSAAIISKTGRRVTNVRDFFSYYKIQDKADIQVCTTDKKILLCMLVRFTFQPIKTFSTDTVNIEDVIKKLEKDQQDAVMAIRLEKRFGYVIFIKGNPAFVFVPIEGGGVDESSLDEFIMYCDKVGKDKPLTIELYDSTRVVPVDDSGFFPEEGIASYYTKEGLNGYFEVYDDEEHFGKFPLMGKVDIGRDPVGDICLPDKGVSRKHAIVEVSGTRFLMKDLESTNGTFINNKKITTYYLRDGDEMKIARFTLKFHRMAAAEAASPIREKFKVPESLDQSDDSMLSAGGEDLGIDMSTPPTSVPNDLAQAPSDQTVMPPAEDEFLVQEEAQEESPVAESPVAESHEQDEFAMESPVEPPAEPEHLVASEPEPAPPEPLEPKKEVQDLASQTIYSEPEMEEVKKNARKRASLTASVVLDDGTDYPLGSITTIGKDEAADIKVEGMLMGKRHAVIIRGKEFFRIIKKGGISAIKVNDEKVDEKILKDNDVIDIGNFKLTFKD